MEASSKYFSVKLWLVAGILMVFIQVIVGGITRLTESGLSITKWEIVSGTLPPMNDADWNREFEKYQKTPQYQEINEGMSLEDFKFIYFWEYVHRLWARFMGFVFLIPFLYFLRKGMLTDVLKRDLYIVVGLAALAATFGWIMVASGLVDRPWVNAYKLSVHLLIALSVFLYLLITYLKYTGVGVTEKHEQRLYVNKWYIGFVILLLIQITLGGILSGMKAAVLYPSWPDMYGEYLPKILLNKSAWTLNAFVEYDKFELMPALVHFLHRNIAYLLWFTGIGISVGLFKQYVKTSRKVYLYMSGTLFVALHCQVLLGIMTVLGSLGKVPVLLGVLHQAGAIILAGVTTWIIFGLTATSKLK